MGRNGPRVCQCGIQGLKELNGCSMTPLVTEIGEDPTEHVTALRGAFNHREDGRCARENDAKGRAKGLADGALGRWY